MEGYLVNSVTQKQLAAPADANASAVTGSRIKLEKGFKVAIVISMGDGAAGVTDFTLQQHDAASAGNSKALTIGVGSYYTKVASATSFTKVDFTSTSNFVPTVFAADEGIIIFEVLAEDLDVNNSFGWISCNIADSTAAKIFSGVYHLHDVRNVPAYELTV